MKFVRVKNKKPIPLKLLNKVMKPGENKISLKTFNKRVKKLKMKKCSRCC